VESKDEFKKRTGFKSPDYSDALTLANAARLGLVTSRKIFSGVTTDLVKSHAQLLNTVLSYKKHLEFVIVASFKESFSSLVLAVDLHRNKIVVLGELVITNSRQLALKDIYLQLSRVRNDIIMERHDPIYYIDYNSLPFITDSNLRYDINWFQLPKDIGKHWNIRELIKTNRLDISEKCTVLFQEILTGTKENPGELIVLLQAICDRYMMDASLNQYPEEEESKRRAFTMHDDLREELENDIFANDIDDY
jgi:hypothetical protein